MALTVCYFVCRLLQKSGRMSMIRNAIWCLSNLCRGKNPPPEFSKVLALFWIEIRMKTVIVMMMVIVMATYSKTVRISVIYEQLCTACFGCWAFPVRRRMVWNALPVNLWGPMPSIDSFHSLKKKCFYPLSAKVALRNSDVHLFICSFLCSLIYSGCVFFPVRVLPSPTLWSLC